MPQWPRDLAGESLGTERPGRDIEAFDHADRLQVGKARFAGIAAAARHPVHLGGDEVAAGFETTVPLFDMAEGFHFRGRRGIEVALHLAEQRGLVFLDGEAVVGARIVDVLGDLWVAGDGVDGDQRPLEDQTLEQDGDGGDLVGFLLDRRLAEHEPRAKQPSPALVGRPGRDWPRPGAGPSCPSSGRGCAARSCPRPSPRNKSVG